MDTAGRSMRRVLTALVVVCGLVLAAAVPTMGAPGGGNSGNASACQQNGYLTLQRADGTRFRNVGECVSYAAHGGVLMAIPTATSIPTATNVPTETPVPTDVPPTDTPVPTATDVPPTAIPPTDVPTDVPTEIPPTIGPTEIPAQSLVVTTAPTNDPLYCMVIVTLTSYPANSVIPITFYLWVWDEYYYGSLTTDASGYASGAPIGSFHTNRTFTVSAGGLSVDAPISC